MSKPAMDDAAPDTGKLQVAAAMLASSVIGAPLVIAVVVRMVLLTIRPDRTGYETEVVFAFALAFAGALAAVVVVLLRLRARAESRAVLRVPYMILVAQIVIGVIVVMALVFTPGD